MLYGLAIPGESADQRRAALIAALDVLRDDLLGKPTEATTRFFSQPGKFVLYLKPAKLDPDNDPRFKR